MPDGKNGKLRSNRERTEENVREITSKGGVASGEARRKKKERRNIFQAVLDGKYEDKKTGQSFTGEELLIRGIAVNLSDTKSKHWLGTVKLVAESLGLTMTDDAKKKLAAEIKKINAETALTEEKIKLVQGGASVDEIEDDDLTRALESVAKEMERGNADQ